MNVFPKTIVIRHKRENLKKCSLFGLEKRNDFHFLTYPRTLCPDLTNYLLLTIDPAAPPLSEEDKKSGIVLLDGTWKLSLKMENNIHALKNLQKRALPAKFMTAYPRRQDDCADPQRGLASVEAIVIAYHILGRNIDGLLDNYYWKENFLKQNAL